MNKKILLCVAIVAIAVGTLSYMSLFKKYTVIFDAQGGTSIAAVQVKKNERVSIPDEPRLEGYIFLGWYLENKEYDFDKPVTENITLTAKWSKQNI